MLEFLKRRLGITPPQKPPPPPYLIEFRLYGSTKQFATKISRELATRFKVVQSSRPGNPAHNTLFGPFNTPDENRLIKEFGDFCRKYDLIGFRLGGFSHINNDVVYLEVEPSQELVEFRRELAQNFMRFTSDYPPYDDKMDRIFHITLAKDLEGKFSKIWNYLSKISTPKRDLYMLRVLLLKNKRVICSYDLIQKRMFSGDDELNDREYEKTVDLVRKIRENGGKRTKS